MSTALISNEEVTVASIVIRNLPDATHRALKLRAKEHGRSAEAEVRAILEAALIPEDRVRLGTLLWEMGQIARDGGLEFKIPPRDQEPHDPIDFS